MELELEFRSGRVYRYRGVPRGVLEWLLRSKNMGAFVTRMIAGRYEEQALPSAGAGGDVCALAEASLEQALRASLARLSVRGRGAEGPRGQGGEMFPRPLDSSAPDPSLTGGTEPSTRLK